MRDQRIVFFMLRTSSELGKRSLIADFPQIFKVLHDKTLSHLVRITFRPVTLLECHNDLIRAAPANLHVININLDLRALRQANTPALFPSPATQRSIRTLIGYVVIQIALNILCRPGLHPALQRLQHTINRPFDDRCRNRLRSRHRNRRAAHRGRLD